MYYDKDNNPMNKFNQFEKYKGHIIRIALSKPIIDNKQPLIPSFFKNGVYNRGTKSEQKLKLRLENDNLFKRLVHAAKKNSQYSSLNIPSKCPAFERKERIQLKKYRDIIERNHSFYKILKKSKSTFDVNKSEEDYFRTRYYKNNISKNRVINNPNLMFVSYRQFYKNIQNSINEKEKNNSLKNNKNKKIILKTNHTKNKIPKGLPPINIPIYSKDCNY